MLCDQQFLHYHHIAWHVAFADSRYLNIKILKGLVYWRTNTIYPCLNLPDDATPWWYWFISTKNEN